MPIPKIDPKKIFASQAPSQDVPAEFNNYERGWDESRKNNGKPTIKQFNKLQQMTDEKILWMHQNGAALPFDETMEYVEGAVVVKDGELQQWKGEEWRSVIAEGLSDTVQTFNTPEAGIDPVTGVADGAYFNVRSSSDESYIDEYRNVGGNAVATGKSYPSRSYVENIAKHTALPFKVGKSYAIYERVMLDNGDIVRSAVDENTNDPNSNMTGWVKVSNTFSVLSITELMEIKGVKKGDVAFVQSYYEPNYTLARPYFGGGRFVATQKASLASNLGTILPSQVNGIWWVRVDYEDVIPEFWGAYGDNSTDDTAKLQAAIDFAQVGVKISNKYKISDTLIVNGKHNFSFYGTGRNSWIRNLGVGKSAVRFINAEGCSLDNFGIIGDGVGFYSPTAQTLHGVEFQNSSLATLTNMVIKSHGGHGVYIHKGGWCFHLTNCKINFNKLDGINALPESKGSGSYFQNGNNLSLINTEINANGGNGVHWKALALNINGGIIERSGASGVFIDNSAWAVSTWGVNITGVYFEANKDHCIRVLTASNAILDGMNIEGNFFGGGSPFPNNGTYIKFEGLYTGVRNTSIRANSMIQYGSSMFIDGGGTLDKSVIIETTYPTQNTLFAKIETSSKTRVINGALSTKSILWSSMVGDSDNFFSSTSQTVIYFALPVDSETFIQSINFNIKTNSTSAYSITSSLISVDPSTGYETQISSDIKNAPLGGDLNVQHNIFKRGVSAPMYLKVTVPALATGSTAKISSPTLTFN